MHRYSSDNLIDYLIFNVNQYLAERHWTLRTLSEQSDIPYESLKKIVNGKIQNPSVVSIIKIANAFECTVDALVSAPNSGWRNVVIEFENTDSKTELNFDHSILRNLSKRSIQFLNLAAYFELQLTRKSTSEFKQYISVVVPTNHLHDGMIFDSCNLETIDITPYYKEFGSLAICGLKITNNSFRPAYLKNDILLIARDRYPNSDEIGVFMSGNKAYLRRYICGTPSQLVPINGVGSPIIADEINSWHFFGRVLTVIRVPD
ncbi:MAG: helix-turn-helix domain-containing protein [Lachnospiraceae bacterium]|nr:helix-turn-helix domain-containing protein [Lachnospiraceae bacterium]